MVALQKTLSRAPGLRKVVYRQFLKSAMLPLFAVVVVLLSLYFWGTYYTSNVSLDAMQKRAEDTLTSITLAEARSLNAKLKEVGRDAGSLKVIAEKLFSSNPFEATGLDDLELQTSEAGVKYRDLQSMLYTGSRVSSSLASSIYISADTELTEPLKHRLRTAEALDQHFQRVVDNNPTITSAYFNTWDNTNRYYPPLERIPGLFPPSMKMHEHNFYFMADAVNNPDRSVVWTGAYLDPAGYGWMLSSIAPVYREGFLEGVIGIDITLSDFTANILSNQLAWGSSAAVVDAKGQILGVSGAMRQLLGLPMHRSRRLLEGYNLFERREFEEQGFAKFVAGQQLSACCLFINDQQYLISQQVVAETDWRLVIITPMDNVNHQILEHQSFLNKMGFYFLSLVIAFLGLFFVYLRLKALALAEKVSKPIDQVADYIWRLNALGSNKPLPSIMVGIRELDHLIGSGSEIQRARNKLSQLNEELAMKNEQLRSLAITDRLTGLPNRHKLDEALAYETKRVKRDAKHSCVALLDIDHFKAVNDTFGHQVGDSILVGIAQIMRRNMRETDLIGRWGGEEFMILLPDMSVEQSAVVLNKLRKRIAMADFHPVKQITVSMGVADAKDFSTEAGVVEAADEALYEAKENGRNRLEQATKKSASALNLQ